MKAAAKPVFDEVLGARTLVASISETLTPGLT